jgi:hypothetical protein
MFPAQFYPMYFRPAILALFAALLFASGAGCRKSESVALPPTVLPPDTVASVHWVGKRRLDLEADAYYFSRVWSLPETARLQSQTFDKLATGFWRLLLGEAGGRQIPAAVLRPLLDELAVRESYLEIRAAAGAPPSFVLATQVSDRYAGVWETNLAIAAELLAGVPAKINPIVHDWMIQRTNPPTCVSLTHVGEWAVLSVGPQSNMLSQDIAARIRRDGVPFVSSGTNLWFEAALDFPRLAVVFPLSAGGEGRGEVEQSLNSQLSTLNRLSLTLTGDGANVITRAKLTFAQPFSASLEPWYLPVDLMHEPLTSFTAIRDIQSWLAGWKPWHDLGIGTAPDQLFFWSLAGSPYQIYLAAPLPDARQQVAELADHLMVKANPWLAANGYISFDRASDSNGVTWGNLPDIKPFIKSAGTGSEGWLFAGLLPATNSAAAPPPNGMIQDVLRRTNLVYYDWEVTGPRLNPLLQLGQTVRLVMRRPQLPLNSASLNWLAALIPRLGTSATVINRTGPAELTFYRRSTIGLTALELQILAGWLNSPQFPQGRLLSSK